MLHLQIFALFWMTVLIIIPAIGSVRQSVEYPHNSPSYLDCMLSGWWVLLVLKVWLSLLFIFLWALSGVITYASH